MVLSKDCLVGKLQGGGAGSISDAFARPSAGNWVARVSKTLRTLGLPASLAPDGSAYFDKYTIYHQVASKHHEAFRGLHAFQMHHDFCFRPGARTLPFEIEFVLHLFAHKAQACMWLMQGIKFLIVRSLMDD